MESANRVCNQLRMLVEQLQSRSRERDCDVLNERVAHSMIIPLMPYEPYDMAAPSVTQFDLAAERTTGRRPRQ